MIVGDVCSGWPEMPLQIFIWVMYWQPIFFILPDDSGTLFYFLLFEWDLFLLLPQGLFAHLLWKSMLLD